MPEGALRVHHAPPGVLAMIRFLLRLPLLIFSAVTIAVLIPLCLVLLVLSNAVEHED